MQTTSTPKVKLCRAAVCVLLACLAAATGLLSPRAQTWKAATRRGEATTQKDKAATPHDEEAAQQDAEPQNKIQVVPKPKSVASTGESFRLTRNARVALADPKSVDGRFAAQDFADDGRASVGASVAVDVGKGKGRILIGTLALPRVRAAIEKAGASVPNDLNEEGYVLVVKSGAVVVAGQTPAGTFYGLQTLKQLVRGEGDAAHIQGVLITDWPSMRWRAVSDDISRGPVPTVEYVKRQLRTEAMYKLNMHSFYMEHVFRSASHPLIAPEGGALTTAQIHAH